MALLPILEFPDARLRTKVDELGYDSVQKVDQDDAKALIKARDAVVKESAK